MLNSSDWYVAEVWFVVSFFFFLRPINVTVFHSLSCILFKWYGIKCRRVTLGQCFCLRLITVSRSSFTSCISVCCCVTFSSRWARGRSACCSTELKLWVEDISYRQQENQPLLNTRRRSRNCSEVPKRKISSRMRNQISQWNRYSWKPGIKKEPLNMLNFYKCYSRYCSEELDHRTSTEYL